MADGLKPAEARPVRGEAASAQLAATSDVSVSDAHFRKKRLPITGDNLRQLSKLADITAAI